MLFGRKKTDIIEKKKIQLTRRVTQLPAMIDYYGLTVSLLGPSLLVPPTALASGDIFYARVVEGTHNKRRIMNAVLASGPRTKIRKLLGQFEWHIGSEPSLIDDVAMALGKVKELVEVLSHVMIMLAEIERGYGGQAACRAATLWQTRNGVPVAEPLMKPALRLTEEPVSIYSDGVGVYIAIATPSYVSLVAAINPMLLEEKSREPRRAIDIVSEILETGQKQEEESRGDREEAETEATPIVDTVLAIKT